MNSTAETKREIARHVASALTNQALAARLRAIVQNAGNDQFSMHERMAFIEEAATRLDPAVIR